MMNMHHTNTVPQYHLFLILLSIHSKEINEPFSQDETQVVSDAGNTMAVYAFDLLLHSDPTRNKHLLLFHPHILEATASLSNSSLWLPIYRYDASSLKKRRMNRIDEELILLETVLLLAMISHTTQQCTPNFQ